MLQFSKLNRKMETRNHSKNRYNLKKLMMFFAAICFSSSLCGQVYKFDIDMESDYGPYKEKIAIDIGKGEITTITVLGSTSYEVETGKYKIIRRKENEVTFRGQKGVAYSIENISKDKSESNDNHTIGIYEEMVVFSANRGGSYPYPFKSGDGNAAVARKLRQEQFNGGGSTSTTSTPTYQYVPATPSASIQNVWLEHGVVVGQTTNSVYNYYYGWQYQNVNVYGMKIHVKFSAENMLYKQGSVVAWFYYENDNKLIMKKVSGYTASDGHLAVSDRFTPSYESAVYNDFVLTMPNNELPSNLKGTTLKVKVGILDNNNNQMTVSEYKYFNMK